MPGESINSTHQIVITFWSKAEDMIFFSAGLTSYIRPYNWRKLFQYCTVWFAAILYVYSRVYSFAIGALTLNYCVG